MLKEMVWHLTHRTLLGNPKTTPFDYYLRMSEAIAPSLTIKLVPIRVETGSDIERAIGWFVQTPNGGLFLLPDPTLGTHRDLVVALAARHRLPAVYTGRHYVTAGGLM